MEGSCAPASAASGAGEAGESVASVLAPGRDCRPQAGAARSLLALLGRCSEEREEGKKSP